ncbi:RDD family protein [Persicobacter diffluens]|uniref:RDD domain-containing protein n=1 Tax=Persicobacter diffluens TaxID=981 RepID=A0AAN4VZY1_9BACT|nr:hypothetical protein PEDI_23390 [Persicobacter diffluens]
MGKVISLLNKRLSWKLEEISGIPVPTADIWLRLINFGIDAFVVQSSLSLFSYFYKLETGWFLNITLFLFYYIFFEYHFQWTLGKFITETRVVDQHGDAPSLEMITIRNLARWIPIGWLRIFQKDNRCWHDTKSQTYIVKKVDALKLKAQHQNSMEDESYISFGWPGSLMILFLFLSYEMDYLVRAHFIPKPEAPLSEKVIQNDLLIQNTLIGDWRFDQEGTPILFTFENDSIAKQHSEAGQVQEFKYVVRDGNLKLRNANRPETKYQVLYRSDSVLKLYSFQKGKTIRARKY